MTTPILMPALSPTMEHGTLARWLKKEGDEVTAGDIIAEIETDKAVMEVEAVDEGVLAKILIAAGTPDVPVNSAIAILMEDGAAPSEDATGKISAAYPAAASGGDAAVAAGASPIGADSRMTGPSGMTGQREDKELSLQGSSKVLSKEALSTAPLSTSKSPSSPGEAAQITSPALETVSDAGLEIHSEIPEDVTPQPLTVRDALRDAMAEEMRRDDAVFVMGEEVAEYEGAYKVTRGLLDEFGPQRVIDTPITEHGFAGLGTGAAFAGLKPVIEFMTWNFAMQAIDHIINSAAKTRYMSGGQMGAPIVFRGPNGAAARVAAQHSQDYANWYGNIPGLIVIAPYSAADAKGLLKAAIRDPNPVVFLEHELCYGDKGLVPDVADHIVPIGKARIVRIGTDITIVSYSRGVMFALEAAEALSKAGISAEVIDLRTIRPLDIATVITSVQKTNRLVTVEEGWGAMGVGAEIGWQTVNAAFDYLDAPPARVTQEEVPLPYAANLETLSLPSSEKVVKAAFEVLYRDRSESR